MQMKPKNLFPLNNLPYTRRRPIACIRSLTEKSKMICQVYIWRHVGAKVPALPHEATRQWFPVHPGQEGKRVSEDR